ncbi:MAG: aspartyl protease family protein [Candidatus Thorarchaeota archaeon]
MEMKFEVNPQSGHIDVPVTVNGEGPLRFTLDTGATATTLWPALIEKLGIKTRVDPEEKYSTMGIEYHLANLDEFSIGPVRMDNEEVIVFDFGARFGHGVSKITGNIGHSTLKNYMLSINYQTLTLRLEKSAERAEDQSIWIPFNYVDDTHLIGVQVSINNQGPFELVLDTGSPVIILSPGLAEELDLDLNEPGPMVKGLGGMTQAHFVPIEQISVGQAVQENANALVLDLSAVSPRGKSLGNGILGASFLNNYEVVIDYPRKKLAFLPSN